LTRSLAILLAVVAAALSSVVAVDPAAAVLNSQLHPLNLRVFGGESAWHADNSFQLDWDQPPGSTVKSVNYRLLDPAGNPLGPDIHLPWAVTHIEGIRVPTKPGAYTVEVWLGGLVGAGPAVSAALRFDDSRPGPVEPLAPDGWLAGNAAAVVEIAHPTGAPPLSGIRGYAVSVDRGEASLPCAGADECSAAETDLHGGVDDDTISLGMLPEGFNIVRAVAVSGSGMHSAVTNSAVVRVDAGRPDVLLSGEPLGWAAGPVRVAAQASDHLSGMAPSGPSGPYTAIVVDGGVPKVEQGAMTAATVSGEGRHEVAAYARDVAGNDGGASPAVVVVRIDESPPRVAFATAQDPAEPERIEVTVADSLSGPDLTRGSIAVRPAGSHQPFAPLPTAGSGSRLVARWDSDASPPGSYEFKATGYDAAGNVAGSDRRAGGARMVLTNPLKRPTALVAGFGGRLMVWQHCSREQGRRRCRRQEIEAFERRPTTRAMPYGHSIAYSGRLTSVSGAALGGLPVQVVENFDPGADPPQRTTTVQTSADGSFETRLAPGPGRRVEAVFAGNRTLTRVGGGGVRLSVLAGVRMHASSGTARIGGAPVVFSGRVGSLGASSAAARRPVELQFHLPGGEWSEFRTVQTDQQGRFRYPYSFSDDDSRGVRFQFRAFAPAEAGWPYEPAASRPVFVTGR
jgi:hypothetical protein